MFYFVLQTVILPGWNRRHLKVTCTITTLRAVKGVGKILKASTTQLCLQERKFKCVYCNVCAMIFIKGLVYKEMCQ